METMSYAEQITMEEYQKQAKFYTKDMVRNLEKEVASNPELASATYYLNQALMHARKREAFMHLWITSITLVGFVLFLLLTKEPVAEGLVRESIASFMCNVPKPFTFTYYDIAAITFAVFWLFPVFRYVKLPFIKPFYLQFLSVVLEHIIPLVEEACILSISYLVLRAAEPTVDENCETMFTQESNSTTHIQIPEEFFGIGIRLAHFGDAVVGSNSSGTLERDGFWSLVWGMYFVVLTSSTIRKVLSIPKKGLLLIGLLISSLEATIYMEYCSYLPSFSMSERAVMYVLMLSWLFSFFSIKTSRDDIKELNGKKELDNKLVMEDQQEIEEVLNLPEEDSESEETSSSSSSCSESSEDDDEANN